MFKKLFKSKKLTTQKYNYRTFNVYDTDNYIVKDYITVARHAYSPELLKKNRQLLLYITTVACKDTPNGNMIMGRKAVVESRFGDLDVEEDRILGVMDFMHALTKMTKDELDEWVDRVVFPKDFLES